MEFWIDGHNLIGALPDIDLTDPADEARLLARLQTFAWRGGHRLVVFFDHGEGGPAPLPRTSGIDVRFAPRGLTADDLIRAALDGVSRGTLESIVLITSDRALVAAARAAGVRTQNSRSFGRQLLELERQSGAAESEKSVSLSAGESDELLRQFEARRAARAEESSRARARKKQQRRKPGT